MHAAARWALIVRRARCRRLGFNYLTGTLPSKLYSVFTVDATSGVEWWKRYARPPPPSRPDEIVTRSLL